MEALDDKEFSGSLITLLQNGEDFVRNNTKKRWKKTDTGRTEMPDYPERAVLECLVNALIHRDYMITGSEVHIDIFDDRMEIYSPRWYDGWLSGAGIEYGLCSLQAPQSCDCGCIQQDELHGAPGQRL